MLNKFKNALRFLPNNLTFYPHVKRHLIINNHINFTNSQPYFKNNFYKLSQRNFVTSSDAYPNAKSDFYDENDLIINIGDKEKFKGQLVICPTPIGNLNDISIRQYEALKNGDLIACEDTRKTGKMLELIQQKKMKEKFYSEFGLSFEDFVNRGGLDMTDEQIKKEFVDSKENLKHDENTNKAENYNDFYQTQKDSDRFNQFVDKQNSSPNNANNKSTNENKTDGPKQKSSENSTNKEKTDKTIFSDNLYHRVVEKVRDVKKKKSIYNIDNMVKVVDSNYSEADQQRDIKDFIKKTDDPVTSDYYSQVIDSEDFMRRKAIIENSDDKFREFIDPIASDFEDKANLSYKMRNKAKFIMGMAKIYSKEKQAEEDQSKSTEEELEEEMNLHSGLDENYFSLFKKRIKDEKDKKGRGLLVSFNQENEEKKIPKLLRAMKMGLRVVLVSDAGTPTISDPGYKLVKEAAKNGIIIEPLPGPSAVLTALSASALPTDKFLFVGYLPKNPADKKEKITEIKKSGITTVLFESPVRLKRTLETIGEIFGDKHEMYVGLELTKKFEKHHHGNVESIIKSFEKEEEVKGEITLILGPFLKAKEEIENEKNLSEEFKIDVYEFSKKLNSILNLPDKEFRNVLTDICNLSNLKANKIINSIKNRSSQIKMFYDKINLKENANIKPLESYLVEENEEEGKSSKVAKVISRSKTKAKIEEKNKTK